MRYQLYALKSIVINAQGKILGRLASRIALLLQGKDKPTYRPERRDSDRIVLFRSDGVKLSGTKLISAYRMHHTGYPGGLKRIPLKHTHARDPRILLKGAVLGMLAHNRLRSRLIKRLTLLRGASTHT